MSSRDYSYGTKSQTNVSTNRYVTQLQSTEPLKITRRLHLALSTERTPIDRRPSKRKRKLLISNPKKLPANFFDDLTPRDSTKNVKTEGREQIREKSQTPHFLDEKLNFTFRNNLTKHLSHQSEERQLRESPARKALGIRLSNSKKVLQFQKHFKSVEAEKMIQSEPVKEENAQKFDWMLNSLINTKNLIEPIATFYKKMKPNLLPPIKFSFNRKQLKP